MKKNYQEQSATALDLRDELLDSAKGDDLLFEVDPASHRIDDGLGLLEDFLLHEGGEVALHDLLDLHLEGGHLAVEWTVIVEAARNAVD